MNQRMTGKPFQAAWTWMDCRNTLQLSREQGVCWRTEEGRGLAEDGGWRGRRQQHTRLGEQERQDQGEKARLQGPTKGLGLQSPRD